MTPPSSWLPTGPRTVLLVGDSLTAQMFYSLSFLLGSAVVEQMEHPEGPHRPPPGNSSSGGGGRNLRSGGSRGRIGAAAGDGGLPTRALCTSGVADEGQGAYSELRLSRGVGAEPPAYLTKLAASNLRAEDALQTVMRVLLYRAAHRPRRASQS